MDQRDINDLREHPEWFLITEVRSRFPDPEFKDKYPQAYRDMVERCINPPVTISRKPVPFVLPIRGSAL